MFLKNLNRINYLKILSVVLPFVLFAFHSLLFRHWIIDDAGISYVYSRNFALGYGFVSQPGMNPVEGFSNFTWVILLTPFFFLKIFDPIIIPKIISLILVLLSYLIIHKIFLQISTYPELGTFLTLFFLSLNTSFVVWTVSGLENPLYIMLIVSILWKTISHDTWTNPAKSAATIAILSSLCALTRPDGILYASIFPVFAFINFLSDKTSRKKIYDSLFLYVGVFVLVFGSYMFFRYFYFGDILPNTYYAKGGAVSLSIFDWLTKIRDLLISIGINKYFFVIVFSTFIYFCISKNISKKLWVVIITLLISLLIYILLPPDWMPEFRFATPFFALAYISIYSLSELVYKKIRLNRITNGIIVTFLFLFALASTYSFFQRSTDFAKKPTVPFTVVAELYAYRYNEYAKMLGISNGSILTPDVGGTLYYSNLKVYDLAGLTDKVIARNLGRNQIFYDYVFDTTKPTFIHTHEWWAYASNFDSDPRFRQDYFAIYETIDPWIFERTGESIFSGDYVRKDAIKNSNVLLLIQASFTNE